MTSSYTDPVVAAFIALPGCVAASLVWAAAVAWRRSGATSEAVWRVSIATAIAAAAWMAGTWVIAASGWLRKWDQTPPPLMLLLAAVMGVAFAIALTPFGARLARFVPLWALVAAQSFRLPLELAMHEVAERGVMPSIMSYSGRNWDIVTGATGIVVAVLLRAGRGGRTLALLWNLLGFALLVNVVVVAILATPVFRYFGEPLNVWVTYPPFVWLPAVLVLAALAGHFVIFRALRRDF